MSGQLQKLSFTAKKKLSINRLLVNSDQGIILLALTKNKFEEFIAYLFDRSVLAEFCLIKPLVMGGRLDFSILRKLD